MKHVVLFSGGFDSSLGLTKCVKDFGPENVVAIFFNIGQRSVETERAAVHWFIDKFKIDWYELDLPIHRTSKNEKPGRNPLMILKALNFVRSVYENEECTLYTYDEWDHTDDYPYGYPHRDFSVSCDVGDYKGLMTQLVEGETSGKVHFEMPVKGKSLLAMRPWIKKYNYTLDDLHHSTSCYAGNNCGECYACKKRRYLEDVVFDESKALEFKWD